MFAHIEGTIAEKNADSIVLDVHGVGFLLTVSGATLAAAPAAGERMKLYTVLNVREDAMELFGFYSREEKRMYERLRGDVYKRQTMSTTPRGCTSATAGTTRAGCRCASRSGTA